MSGFGAGGIRAGRRRGQALLAAAFASAVSPASAPVSSPPLSPLSAASRAFGTRNFFGGSWSSARALPAPLSRETRTTTTTTTTTTTLGSGSSSTRRDFSSSIFQMSAPTEISATKMFGGFNRRYEHESSTLGCKMKFTVYTPPEAKFVKFPVVYWLSGLTCTDENFIQKSGAQRYAAELGVALIAPDTSPRGLNVEGESESWDFGVGAGFYLNATVEKWKNWCMYDYIVQELPGILASHFESLDTSRSSIMGHSMGGHGALTIFLKNPGKYRSVSAFAPICNPSRCPWGVKAFTGYLGEDSKDWEAYDATNLVANYHGPHLDILIDQGEKDSFLTANQLLPENFREACSKQSNVSLTLRYQGGYDHSYFFIASFISDHLEFHANALSGEEEEE